MYLQARPFSARLGEGKVSRDHLSNHAGEEKKGEKEGENEYPSLHTGERGKQLGRPGLSRESRKEERKKKKE